MSWMSDEQMERTVLGAMILDARALAECCDSLAGTDFVIDSHRTIFRALTQMAALHQHLDYATLCAWLEERKELSAVGGQPYLAFLTEGIPHNPDVKGYQRRLRAMAKRRALHVALTDALAHVEDSERVSVTIERLNEDLAAIEDTGTDLIDATAAALRVADAIRPEANVLTYSTGIRALDIRTGGGLRAGRLWVDGALPARGKSSLGRQIAARCAQAGTPTLVFSIEMTVEEWFGIDAANAAGLEAWKIQQPQYINAETRDHLHNTLAELGKWPIWFDDSGEQTIARMLSRARLAVLRHGVKVIVVDYLQRVEGGGKDDLRTRIGRVAKKLAEFAKKHKVAVLLLSQLSRPADINERPTMNKLKESGDIEAHAHVVVLNYRPVDRETEDFTGEDELIVAKNRFGKPGTVFVHYNANRMEFQERTT